MKRAIVIVLATVAICVAATVILTRDDLRERQLRALVSRDESRFDEMLHDGGEIERRALKPFLRTEAGRAFLARRCKDVLGLMRDVLAVQPPAQPVGCNGVLGGTMVHRHRLEGKRLIVRDTLT